MISAEYVNQTHVPVIVLQLNEQLQLKKIDLVGLLLFFVPGANPKKPSAPDMFTESDDMFAADFDVSLVILISIEGLDINITQIINYLHILCLI